MRNTGLILTGTLLLGGGALFYTTMSEQQQAINGWKPVNEEMRMLLNREESRREPTKENAAPKPASPPTEAKQPAKVAEPQKVNLNTASAEQLEALPGIGASRARAILELRTSLGGKFTSVEQLLDVKGIGEKMLDKMRPQLVLE
ncbi:ComEA family DNA-binding protein [Paenibacillus silviterrae]|uniref:ComEA family DNA-binding protein n=1 Tax=Paenibacillus silviterrae TaxID=3242194 RepID=UPI00254360D5|nr:helix-hairpin-helix domain-containing protein [Paenibacillus chinjuensis]